MAALPSSFAAASAMADPARILDSLSTSVLIVDRARAVLYLNVAAETLFGVSRNQVRGRPLAELLVDATALDAVVDRALETWRPFSRRELALRPVNGDGELIVDCTVAPYEEPSAPPAVLIEISDATQHQRITRETALLTQIGGSRADDSPARARDQKSARRSARRGAVARARARRRVACANTPR